ncbi:hypothetical protein DEA8626_03212 [Defluviimonas aquaemixtae]|uniref:Peptidoglycan binding-like domain-containing protein n=1 Tax=Albidovulum aquaemixtae TaxID=1542388 RepID=A0A2R8BLD9_9RHOB|nr:antifreeze protein [Defluviimonas aquaemixtae]SPH24163.1 hypothetical protein DEA8626_03212 [Defluviimonas aquaemixtae]
MLHKSRTAATAAVLIAALAAAPAHAWGKKEQNLLKGLAAAAIVGTIIYQSRNNSPAARSYSTQPRYYAAPASRTYQEPTRYKPAPKSSVYSTPAARAFNSYTASERRLIQSRMTDAGYYHGGIDGAFGPMTYRATKALAGDTTGTDQIATVSGAYEFYDLLIR